MLRIVITSTNIGKITATKKVLAEIFKNYQLIPIEVNSGVSKTPLSEEEGIRGCLQRIANAKKIIHDADIYLGLEGVISKNEFGSFICGWAVVDYVKIDRMGMGCGAKVQLPEIYAKKINDYDELSEVIKKEYPSGMVEKMREIGANGVITNGLYTRVDNFTDALHSAFGYIQNDANWG